MRHAAQITRARTMETFAPLTTDQEAAVISYAAYAGRNWKSALLAAWMNSATHQTQGHLQAIRNSHGPSWLATYKLPRAT
jgi:hypothetical protein